MSAAVRQATMFQLVDEMSKVVFILTMSRQEDRWSQRTAFTKTLLHVMGLKKVTHRQLGDAVGKSHTVVTGWKQLNREPPPVTVFKIERFLQLPPGFLSVHLGYLPPEARSNSFSGDFDTIVDRDPALDDRGRRALKAAYAELRS